MKNPYIQERKTYGGGTSINIAEAQWPNLTARLAAAIAERFALVAAVPDGEDSAGRQKLRLPTAEELAARACDLAEAMASQFEARSWLLDVPEPKLGKNEVYREDAESATAD